MKRKLKELHLMGHEQGGMNMVREVQNIFLIEQKQIVKISIFINYVLMASSPQIPLRNLNERKRFYEELSEH